MTTNEWTEIINIVILAITAWIVWKYTKAAQRSNDIQERPILNFYLREEKSGPNTIYTLRIRNVGNGPAYNIKFSDIKTNNGYTYYPYFNHANPILEKNGDEKTVNMWVKTPNGVEAYDNILGFKFFLSRLFIKTNEPDKQERIKRISGVFLVNYEGVNNKKYYSVFRLYSKIWPASDVFDLIVEFIENGANEYRLEQAHKLCAGKETMKRFE